MIFESLPMGTILWFCSPPTSLSSHPQLPGNGVHSFHPCSTSCPGTDTATIIIISCDFLLRAPKTSPLTATHPCTCSVTFTTDLPKHQRAKCSTSSLLFMHKNAFLKCKPGLHPILLGQSVSQGEVLTQPALGVADQVMQSRKSNYFPQMHFLQRRFSGTRLILILKTKEASKGNTCGYTAVLLEQAGAHEYQLINIQDKHCTSACRSH